MDGVYEWVVNIVAAMVAGGIVTLLLSRHFERTTEHRKLYAKAYKVVLSWQEMLYRVRRRPSGDEAEEELIVKFHDLQEELNYYQGIISSESHSMGKSFANFVASVKKENVILIQEAWEQPIRKPKSGTPKTDKHPNISNISEAFLTDTRLWLKWWQLPKIAVWWRNKK